jgi:ribosomal protein S12 methylthiotransferase
MYKSERIIDIITMGCSKNLVDSEMLMRQFSENGFKIYHNPERLHGDIAVVNTCGFIGDAKEESINLIMDLCEKKKNGFIKKVYVMGCLSERYLCELTKEIPQVDKFYGKFNWVELLNDLNLHYHNELRLERQQTTPAHYAYIKISEGCNRHCAYCAIPIITGKHQSRPIEDILDEVGLFVEKGVKEFQIIAQELTYYGIDIYQRQALPELIDRMASIKGVEWIRLHYAYPTNFPYTLMDVMAKHANVCKYIDIALQHISDNVLSKMHRHITKAETYQLLHDLRERVPGICIRTTLMVGFPGEKDADFQELLKFVNDIKFDRLGAFMYCEEEGTYAAEHYTDDVPQEIKQHRYDLLMETQQSISETLGKAKIGKTFRTIIDRVEGEYYIGRTEYDSPDVDGEVLIKKTDSETISVGEFYNVIITDADEYDLYGKIENV